MKTNKENYGCTDGLIKEAIENVVGNIGIEISDEESEDIVSTCCRGNGSASDTASEEIDSPRYPPDEGLEGLICFRGPSC
jgi:hypothetical protein